MIEKIKSCLPVAERWITMENDMTQDSVSTRRLICFYCGTIYDEDKGRCPLCGSTATSGVSENRPTRRPTVAEQGQKERKKKGKYVGTKRKRRPAAADAAKPRKGSSTSRVLLIGAVVLLALSVLVVGYFIGDMIGLWPGLEDRVERDYNNTDVLETIKCSQLIVEPEYLRFTAPGETQTLTVRVNADCEEVVYCTSSNVNVATISLQAETSEGAQMKTASFVITAVSAGEAELSFTCGDLSATCQVVCPPAETTVATSSTQVYVPELNLDSTVVLTQVDAQALLRVLNLPDGSGVHWASSNENVITVDSDGFVTAVAEGTASVTATVDGWSSVVLFRVDLSDDSPYLDDITFDLDIDKYFKVQLMDGDDDPIDDINYVIDDADICEDVEGRIYGRREGVTQIIAAYMGETYVCMVFVS